MIQTYCLYLAFPTPSYPLIQASDMLRLTEEISTSDNGRKKELNRMNSILMFPTSVEYVTSANNFSCYSFATFAT